MRYFRDIIFRNCEFREGQDVNQHKSLVRKKKLKARNHLPELKVFESTILKCSSRNRTYGLHGFGLDSCG